MDDADDTESDDGADTTDDVGSDVDQDVTVAPQVERERAERPAADEQAAPVTAVVPTQPAVQQQPSPATRIPVEVADELPSAQGATPAAPEVTAAVAAQSPAALAATGGTAVTLLGLAAITLLLGAAMVRSARRPLPVRVPRDPK